MLTLKQETMLGNVPNDWAVKPLKKLLKFNAPGDWGDDGGPNMYRVLRSTNLTNKRRLDLSDIALRALKRKRHPSTVLSTESKSEMILATPLGSGVQPAILATQFQGRKSSTRFTG